MSHLAMIPHKKLHAVIIQPSRVANLHYLPPTEEGCLKAWCDALPRWHQESVLGTAGQLRDTWAADFGASLQTQNEETLRAFVAVAGRAGFDRGGKRESKRCQHSRQESSGGNEEKRVMRSR